METFLVDYIRKQVHNMSLKQMLRSNKISENFKF